MCGISLYLDKGLGFIDQYCDIEGRIKHRGPDETRHVVTKFDGKKLYLTFHRLAVNGQSGQSGQPMWYKNIILMCNGEIYNYRELIERYGLRNVYQSQSDCEIIAHLYYILPLDVLLNELRGVFAFCLVDKEKGVIVVARDPLGVRSLYYNDDMSGFNVCSELKGLARPDQSAMQVKGGTYMLYSSSSGLQKFQYYSLSRELVQYPDMDSVADRLLKLLMQSVTRRTLCDRETAEGYPAIGAYLSGGFDSSAVAALLASVYSGKLHTFSIGFKDAPDLIAARSVAEHIGSHHHEVVVTEEEMLEVLVSMPAIIESYDVTTNRASAFMYRLSKYIREETDIIVVYSGEGSDELFGSYMYFHNAPSNEEFHSETLRLLEDLQYFDLLRGDKSSAAVGLEIRVPFLDIDFVNYVVGIPPEMKMHNGIEKYVLRKALSGTGLMPEHICWRTKEAMSDGVSHESNSWSDIIQETASVAYGLGPIESEKKLYRELFLEAYPNSLHTIPYEWLPKWCGDNMDASARKLEHYKKMMERKL